MAAYWEDIAFVEGIRIQVDTRVSALGYPTPAYSFLGMRAAMKKFVTDWISVESRDGFIRDCVKKIVKLYKSNGVASEKVKSGVEGEPLRLPAMRTPNQDISSNAGIIWATVDPTISEYKEIIIDTENVRKEFWDNKNPPFDFVHLGRTEAENAAFEWVNAQIERDTENAGDHSRFEFDIQLDFHDVDIFKMLEFTRSTRQLGSFRGEFAHYIFRDGRENVKQILSSFMELLEKEKVSFTSVMLKPIRDTIRMPTYEAESSVIYQKPIVIGVYGKVRQILDAASVIAEKTGWWKPEGALLYIMTGIPPAPTMGHSGQMGGKFGNFSIESLGPISEEEVVKQYRAARKMYGWRAPKFTAVDLALLEIHAHMPYASWPEIHRRWKEWRHQHPELTDFEKTSVERAPDSMNQAWKRAVAKIDWQRSSPQL